MLLLRPYHGYTYSYCAGTACCNYTLYSPCSLYSPHCRYCVLLAGEFDPSLLKEGHALFTAHRDVRDVLLSLSQAG